MLDLIRAMFATPEAQRDPYVWAAVAMAHAWIGLGAALVLSLIDRRTGPIIVAVAYVVLWELPQARESALWADSAFDAAMWAFGCVLAAQARSVRVPAAVWAASVLAIWVGVEARA